MTRQRVWPALCGLLALSAPVWAEEPSSVRPATPSAESEQPVSSSRHSCGPEYRVAGASTSGSETIPAHFEYIQIETSDIRLYETFFEKILRAENNEVIDHPQKDVIRGYCYRNVHIVIRQDVQHPRPTGWIQLNFAVPDARSVYADLSAVSDRSFPATILEEERQKVVRFKLKPEVTRGQRKAVRLEVYGPEGFLVGFDQYLTSPE
ncbi:MAG: exported protein of unknown function [Nitrospira sp.]|nr:MAG: exported protein of unknown function [Nitrospira sp.]